MQCVLCGGTKMSSKSKVLALSSFLDCSHPIPPGNYPLLQKAPPLKMLGMLEEETAEGQLGAGASCMGYGRRHPSGLISV